VNSEVKTFNRKLMKFMKPFKHITVVKVDLKRKFFTKQGVRMNSVGKEKIELKIANIVTTTLQKQIEEPVSLYWKTEYDSGVSFASSKDNIIIQEDLKVAASGNQEAVSNIADQEESVSEVKGITDDWTQLENLENSTEVSNCSTAEVL
jgi:hypothetical protein